MSEDSEGWCEKIDAMMVVERKNFPNPATAGENSFVGSFGKIELHSEAFLSRFFLLEDSEGRGEKIDVIMVVERKTFRILG